MRAHGIVSVKTKFFSRFWRIYTSWDNLNTEKCSVLESDLSLRGCMVGCAPGRLDELHSHSAFKNLSIIDRCPGSINSVCHSSLRQFWNRTQPRGSVVLIVLIVPDEINVLENNSLTTEVNVRAQTPVNGAGRQGPNTTRPLHSDRQFSGVALAGRVACALGPWDVRNIRRFANPSLRLCHVLHMN
jgi:hypothetical protein